MKFCFQIYYLLRYVRGWICFVLMNLFYAPMDVFSIAKATHWPGNPTWGVMCTAHWHHQVFSPGSHQSPELWEFCATAKGNKINVVSLFSLIWETVCESCTALQARIRQVTRLLKILQLNKQTNKRAKSPPFLALLLQYSLLWCQYALLVRTNAHRCFNYIYSSFKRYPTSLLHL